MRYYFCLITAGKSFFGKTYLEPKGYVHINRVSLLSSQHYTTV